LYSKTTKLLKGKNVALLILTDWIIQTVGLELKKWQRNIVGMFTKLWKRLLALSCLTIYLSWNNWAPTGWIFTNS